MALAATQFTQTRRSPLGVRRYEITGLFTGPASYTAGGESLTEAILKVVGGIRTVEILQFTSLLDATFANAKSLSFDRNKSGSTAGKIHSYDAAGTETAGATNLSTFTCSFRLVGY